MRVQGYIIVTVKFEQEGDQWAATCLELGTGACGDSREEAQEAIREAILLQLNTLEEMGECASFFKRHGITFYTREPRVTDTAKRIRIRPGQSVERLIEAIPAMA